MQIRGRKTAVDSDHQCSADLAQSIVSQSTQVLGERSNRNAHECGEKDVPLDQTHLRHQLCGPNIGEGPHRNRDEPSRQHQRNPGRSRSVWVLEPPDTYTENSTGIDFG